MNPLVIENKEKQKTSLVMWRLSNGNSIGAGKFQLIWDGKDGNGNALASGVYWYYFTNEDGTTKKGKIVLNR